MGTRSLTFVKNEHGKDILCMYRQFDGYPSGHGQDLKTFFGRHTIVNGLSGDKGPVANGMSCLAAQVVAKFKDGPGHVYLEEPDRSIDGWEEYRYTLYYGGESDDYFEGNANQPIMLKVEDTVYMGYDQESEQSIKSWVTIYDGKLSEFDPDECEEESKRITNFAYEKVVEYMEDD